MNEQKTSWTPWDKRDDLPKAVLKTVVWDGNLHKWYMDISPVGRLPEELYDELVKGWDLIKFIADKFSYSCGCSEPDNLQPRRYTEEEKERGKRLFEIRHFLPTMDVEGKERGKLLFEIVKESDLSADEYNRMLHEHPEPYDVVIKELKILEKIKRREYIALHGDIIETSNCTDENSVQPNTGSCKGNDKNTEKNPRKKRVTNSIAKNTDIQARAYELVSKNPSLKNKQIAKLLNVSEPVISNEPLKSIIIHARVGTGTVNAMSEEEAEIENAKRK